MKPEQIIQNKIRFALSKYGRCFRTNSGRFFTGTKTKMHRGKLRWSNEFKQFVLTNLKEVDVLTNIRAIEGLPEGFSDTLFVGDDGRVGFIEIKQPGKKPTDAQKNFLAQMGALGHIVGVAHSVEEAIALVESSAKP